MSRAARRSPGAAGRALLWAAALIALAPCNSVLDLPEATLIPEQPTLEDAAGPLCREYCDTVMASCQGASQVYANRVQCLNLCIVMEPGSPGDDATNTVQCRLLNARLARDTGEPASHCPQAGPGGASAAPGAASCSTNCEGLCAGMIRICPEEFSSLTACLDDCASVPDLGGYSIGIGQGNSVQCRLFHLGAAAAAPAPHCMHAAGASPCR